MPLSLLKKNDLLLLQKDLREGAQRFLEHIEPYRQRWVTERIQVQPWPRASFRMPTWQAHRGYWTGGAPQNTLQSLIEAKNQNAPMVEFDVRLTKDKIPVLFHDPDLSVVGHPELKLVELTLEELRRKLKNKIPLTTLREVLLSSKVPPLLNIELKSEQIWDDPLERQVCALIQELGCEERILFSSFNPFSIWKVSKLLPQVPRAFLVSPETEARSLREMWFAPFLKIHLLHLDKTMVTEGSMRIYQRMNIPIAVWTAQTPEEIQHYLDLGVASVITDVPPHSALQPG